MAFGSALATSPKPPVLANGTASDVRIVTRKTLHPTPEGRSLHQPNCTTWGSPTMPSARRVCQQAITKFKVTGSRFLTWNFEPVTLNYFLALHRGQEFGVRLGLAEAFEDDFHLLDGRERVQDAAHDPDAREVFFADQEFLFARAGALDVNRGEEAFINEPAVEMDFAVARTFELFKDHVVHARAGVNQCR